MRRCLLILVILVCAVSAYGFGCGDCRERGGFWYNVAYAQTLMNGGTEDDARRAGQEAWCHDVIRHWPECSGCDNPWPEGGCTPD